MSIAKPNIYSNMRYRRANIHGGTYFFTLVTFNRNKLFLCQDNIELLRHAFRKVKKSHPFKIDAFVLLPDHLHCIWTMPSGDADFSRRWRLIKSAFTRGCQDKFKQYNTTSRLKKKEQAVWQRRFWEHMIRDDNDLVSHIEYIHFNPVKHGLVKAPKDWEFSSFHRYVRHGLCNIDWVTAADVQNDLGSAGE